MAWLSVWLLSCIFSLPVYPQETGIKFENLSFDEALARAHTSGKYLFIDSSFFPKEASPGQSERYLAIINHFLDRRENEKYKTCLLRIVQNLESVKKNKIG